MANGYGNLGGYGSLGGYGNLDLSGAYSSGYGKSYEPSYPPQPYKFGYDVKDHYGSTLQQKEEGDAHGNKRGSYGYTDGHGIYRQVDYVADKNGFRASIKTNEPGTDNQDPADVNIHSSAPRYIESEPTLYKAQSYSAPSYSAPILSKGYGESLSLGSLSGLGSLGGYGKAQSIPAVYYAKGY
jgi:hypothetical protein